MVVFRRVPRAEMAANHARAREAAATAANPKLAARPHERALNTAAVLDLGNLVFFTFRGRAYGIPPLGWQAGQRMVLLWAEACEFSGSLSRATTPRYFEIISELPAMLWAACRPVGRLRRLLRRLGLSRNPFAAATEGELVRLVGFFLSLRTRSDVGFPEPRTGPLPARAT